MPLVVFSVVVLFFDEKGCLVRGRRLLLLKGEEDFRGSRRERTKRRGVWLVTSLNVEEMELLVGKTPGGVYFAPDACSTPREEVYTCEKVQVLRVEGSVSRCSWDLESRGSWCRSRSCRFSRRKEPVGFLERLTRKEVALRKGRLSICVLVRASAVPVFKDLLGAGRYAPWF